MSAARLLSLLLEKECRDGTIARGSPLPSVVELAARFEVSRMTALRALTLLAGRGLATKRPGSRRYHNAYRETGPRHREPGFPVLEPRWLRIAAGLRTGLLDGTLGAEGTLPTAKELLLQFGAHPHTLRKALSRLENEGWLIRRGREWRVAGARPARRDASVWLVGLRDAVHPQQPAFAPLMRALQERVHRIGWGELGVAAAEEPRAVFRPGTTAVAGFVYMTFGVHTPWREFLEAHPRIPLAIVDCSEQFQPPLARKLHAWIRPDNARAGLELGQHLLHRGHRRIAYFCHVPFKADWARLRLEGLRTVFGAAHGTSLENLGIDALSIRGRDIYAGLGLPEAALALQALRPPLRLPEALREQQAFALHEGYYLSQVGRRMEAVFEKALAARPRATAWVCANDYLALIAMDFLARRGLKPPHPIAVAGFDDLAASHDAALTSYDFGFGRFGAAAISFLLNPKALALDDRRSLRIPGRLVARQSA